MTKKRIFWVVVIIVILLVSLKSCFNIEITKKLTAKDVAVKVLENLGILNAKVDQLAADVDTIKVDVRELKNRKGSTTIWRTKTVVVPQTGQLLIDPVYSSPPTPEVPEQDGRQTSRNDNVPSYNSLESEDLIFCIDLEPNKNLPDDKKKFLFWSMKHELGINVPRLVPNFTGRLANMQLGSGDSVDDLAVFDGEVLRMSIATVERYYAIIMGVPAPSGYSPAIRSNKRGWNNTLMRRSGGYFVQSF